MFTTWVYECDVDCTCILVAKLITFMNIDCAKLSKLIDILQSLAAELLYKVSNYNKGKDYLNFNTKIGDEIKNLINKKSANLENSTTEYLKATISRLRPPLTPGQYAMNIECGYQKQTSSNKGE